ncbi:MAG: hypothetical protein K1X67_18895 [Fimbriimonadaceae bacterium]|nr:hypothetical protein [Fimbriimonadaceae bacterium]
MSQSGRRRPVEAIEARNLRTIECEQRVRKAVAKLSKTGLPFTVEEVCRRAGVGKTFVYDKKRPELTQLVLTARDTSQERVSRGPDVDANEQTASWRTRAINAEARLKQLRRQVIAQEARISDLTGQLFDPEGNHLADENARLRDHLDSLSTEITCIRGDLAIAQRSLTAARAQVRREQERTLTVVRKST